MSPFSVISLSQTGFGAGYSYMSTTPNQPGADENLDRLLQRAAEGDSDAFGQLVEEFRDGIRDFAERRIDRQLQKRIDASDVVQQTLVKAHRRIKEFVERRPMPLKVWLLKTAMEQLRDERVKHLKRERRAATREVGLPHQTSIVLARQLATHSTPSEVAMRREQQKTVADTIERMGRADSDVLFLRHIDDLKFDEVGAILEITAAAARKRYARAIVRLRNLCVERGITSGI
jgi:RNA polymerase sigma-70 factor (ECF subfamily)